MSDILETVRKLRAMATSSNPNEAAAFAAQADRLIQKHRLEEAELEAASGESETIDLSKEPLFTAQRMRPWRVALGVVLCRQYSVACYSHCLPTSEGYRWGFRMVGTPSDVATVRDSYEHLHAEITRLSTLERDSFRYGCVAGISQAFDAQRKVIASPGAGPGAMVLVSRAAQAEAKKVELVGKLPKGHAPTGQHDRDAYERGRSVGKTLSPKPVKALC